MFAAALRLFLVASIFATAAGDRGVAAAAFGEVIFASDGLRDGSLGPIGQASAPGACPLNRFGEASVWLDRISADVGFGAVAPAPPCVSAAQSISPRPLSSAHELAGRLWSKFCGAVGHIWAIMSEQSTSQPVGARVPLAVGVARYALFDEPLVANLLYLWRAKVDKRAVDGGLRTADRSLHEPA